MNAPTPNAMALAYVFSFLDRLFDRARRVYLKQVEPPQTNRPYSPGAPGSSKHIQARGAPHGDAR